MFHHRGTEYTAGNQGGDPDDWVLSRQVISSAIEVHRALGPGLLESSYQACLSHEFKLRGLCCVEQVAVPLKYKDTIVPAAYRVDFVVERRLAVEVKSVEALNPIHHAQLLTYLKLLQLRRGLLINFNAETLVRGVRRVVNGY